MWSISTYLYQIIIKEDSAHCNPSVRIKSTLHHFFSFLDFSLGGYSFHGPFCTFLFVIIIISLFLPLSLSFFFLLLLVSVLFVSGNTWMGRLNECQDEHLIPTFRYHPCTSSSPPPFGLHRRAQRRGWGRLPLRLRPLLLPLLHPTPSRSGKRGGDRGGPPRLLRPALRSSAHPRQQHPVSAIGWEWRVQRAAAGHACGHHARLDGRIAHHPTCPSSIHHRCLCPIVLLRSCGRLRSVRCRRKPRASAWTP